MGTAPNLKYYADRVDEIVGIDFNAAMQPYALESAAQEGVPAGKLQLVVGRAENLPLPDSCMDAVVATHVSLPCAAARPVQ
jgi:ubiquinone/menaquinone biosynthesis C-methylase UbiE